MPLSVDIDGNSLTEIAQSIRWRQNLSRPSMGVINVPGHLYSASTGVGEMHIYSNGGLVFSGPVWNVQGEGGADAAYVEITAFDHLIYLQKRLCKTSTGNLITPGDVLLDEVDGPSILSTYIQNAIDEADHNPSAAGADPLPLSIGSVAADDTDLSGVPMNFPMSIDQMRGLLVSTGWLDVVVNPGIGESSVDFYAGDYGVDRSGSVSFQYGTGSFNSVISTITFDMEEVINALWYLLGPRVNDERWRGSITPTAANAGGDGQRPGGRPGTEWPPELVARFMASRANYGYMQEIRVFDDKGDEQSIRPLFEEEWANEAWIRATPRTFASVRPQRGTQPSFNVGDLIHVASGSMMNGGFSGAQRVYEVEWACDPDGVMECVEILASDDQEGAA